MTALTNHANISKKDGILTAFKVAANTTIYAGSIVGVNVNGYLEPAAANLTGQKFAGIAADGTLNVNTTDGAESILVFRKGMFELPVTGADQTKIGSPVYVVDSGTLTITDPGAGVIVGKIVQMSNTKSGYAWVDISNYT